MTSRFKSLAIAAVAALAIVPATASAGGAPKGNLVAGAVASKDHQTLVAAVKVAGLPILSLARGRSPCLRRLTLLLPACPRAPSTHFYSLPTATSCGPC